MTRKTATKTSEWVSFSPYGEKRTTTNTIAAANKRSKAGNKAKNDFTKSSSSDGWPLDETINDIEHQTTKQDDNMVVMTRQPEDIEVVFSDTTRARPSKTTSSQPRSKQLGMGYALTKINSNSYVSMREDNGESCDSNIDTPTINPKRKARSAAIAQGPDPRSSGQIRTSRNSRSKARLSSPSPPPPPQASSQQGRSSTPIGDRVGAALSNLNHHGSNNGKTFHSNFTWDESVSSQRSISAKKLQGSESEEEKLSSVFGGSRRRKIKCCLAVLAVFLLAGIAFLVGQLVPVLPATNFLPATNAPASSTPNSDASKSGFNYTVNTDLLVGVYYYPWHGDSFHNGQGYMRRDLVPQHVPALGEYNDSDPGIIAHHMKWFRQANIGLLVTSWWGPNRLEDSNTKDAIMEHDDVGNLKIALHYETSSRLGFGVEKISNAKTDMKYMCENYFDHPNYYKIDGRPVLFIYVSRKLYTVGTLEEALLTMRSAANKCGHNLYLIGDVVFSSAPDPNEPHLPFWYFDAVTNYDVYGSSGAPEGHAGTDRVDNYYQQQAEWKEQALQEGCRYVPAVSPGYNDRGVRIEKDHPPLSRRITSRSKEGSLFQYQLKQAKKLVDSKVDNMILVNSFNEWHEDTQIEPVIGEPASWPFNITKGVEYVGYGELYLDILGAATSSDTSQHTKYDYLI